ncbi:MAG: SH3 domain-containing protein [Coleofasciculus sp. B1-GNL1-01]|uniref:SH3 domain-containing protein n=1 Tax=Coleofasciculus sp. B1-GNL1-01 TaxID=3068484 RepID=UPI0032FCFAE1
MQVKFGKAMKSLYKLIGLTTPALMALGTASAVATTPSSPRHQPSTSAGMSVENETPDKLAQVSANCRQVAAIGGGLYVREQPTVYSESVTVLTDGQTVTIENGGTKYWVPISAPVSGYAFRGFLTSC